MTKNEARLRIIDRKWDSRRRGSSDAFTGANFKRPLRVSEFLRVAYDNNSNNNNNNNNNKGGEGPLVVGY